jgi:hypothetical protein
VCGAAAVAVAVAASESETGRPGRRTATAAHTAAQQQAAAEPDCQCRQTSGPEGGSRRTSTTHGWE